MSHLSPFLFPYAQYRGKFTLQNLALNANLQEFAQKAAIISTLETAGKISPEAAYQQLARLWAQLQTGYENLHDS